MLARRHDEVAVERPALHIAAHAPLEVFILGPQLIVKDGVEIDPPAPQQRRVLAVLASRPSEVVSREWIANKLWGAAKATQLRGLQSYVSHLRSILGTRAIELVGGGYRLNIDPSCIDEVAFKRHIALGLDEAAHGRYRGARQHLEAGLALYRGEPYDDMGNGDFEVRRTGLRQLRDTAEDALLRMSVDLIREAQDCDALIPHLAEAYAEQPDRELRVLLYARTLAMAGRLAEAGDVFTQFASRLREHTGAEPSPELAETMKDLAKRHRRALSRSWGSSVDFPTHAAPLFGRQVEFNAAVSMLEVGHSSLLTIAGPAGVGKTRLASAIATELADDLPGGVLWVDASGMTSADEVLATLGEALRLSGGTSAIKQALPKVLGERRTLVVIDGLHGLDVKAAVAVLLWAGPHVAVIVTATGPVGLASEQVLHLRAFSTSGTAQHPSPASGFVMAALQRLGVDGPADMSTVQSSSATTSGLPSELEQLALDLITGSVDAPPDLRPSS